MDTALPPFDRTSAAYQRRWWILAVLCLSLLVIIVDNSILNVAIPTLVRELGATNSQLQWMVDSYTLVFAGLLLTAGSLGDRFGRKGALQVGMAVFGLGSLASALIDTPNQLIATRSLMGIGGAFIMPATLSIITNVFPPEERGRAIGMWAAIAGVATALGPISGGFLVEHFYWGSIFLVNLPIVAVALIGGGVLIPTSRDPSKPAFDPLGALLSVVGLVALVYAIIEAPERGWTDAGTLAAFALAAVVLAQFAAWESRRAEPDARHVVLPQPPLHRRERGDHAPVLRDVRHDLPAHAVPAVRDGVRRAAGRRQAAPDGGHDAPGRTQQRPAGRALRHEAGGRPGSVGGRGRTGLPRRNTGGEPVVLGRRVVAARHVRRGHGPHHGSGHGVDHGLPSPGQGGGGVGHERLDAPGRRRAGRGDRGQRDVLRLRLARRRRVHGVRRPRRGHRDGARRAGTGGRGGDPHRPARRDRRAPRARGEGGVRGRAAPRGPGGRGRGRHRCVRGVPLPARRGGEPATEPEAAREPVAAGAPGR